MAILELEQIAVGYGRFHVIEDVSLSLHEGEFLSIIGPNGAGKTTLIGAMSGALAPSGGRILFEQKDVTRWAADKRARAGIGRSYQKTHLFPNLTARANVQLAVQARRGVRLRQVLSRVAQEIQAEATEGLRQVGLEGHADLSAAALSHGDKRKLELAMLLALQPKVLLLDEPTAGMSLAEAPAILDLIAGLKASGRYSLVLVEHKLEVVMRLSDRVAVMHQGALLTHGTPAEVMANPEVERAYLGTAHGRANYGQ
ncbi:MAG: hypothetical protein A2201_12080 [Alicyclobacillus sp. RIFOXYA1_FULL_53_8]|nr:MAG: hypothetical protein A2201_12080 [Alicyclobacillus sp. RIFOXYA1_FULL_53_8]